jgi:hypothetical protein
MMTLEPSKKKQRLHNCNFVDQSSQWETWLRIWPQVDICIVKRPFSLLRRDKIAAIFMVKLRSCEGF